MKVNPCLEVAAAAEQNGSAIRLLVVIASYGEKNLVFLKRIIQTYLSMPMEVEVIVISEAAKNLGCEVKVIVGLPSKDPWSLPFAHKPIFMEKLEQCDLFIYSEDDIQVTHELIKAFMRVQKLLQPDEIAGFLRYEIDQHQKRHFPDVHGCFHWNAESARRRGASTIAEFTNEHAAFYILTQDQLRRAISSGGFLRPPQEGRHDLACTAATDPYINCGFRKVLCISALDQFLIHHMSNRYAGQVGLPFSLFQEQVKTLMDISNGTHPASTLCKTESKFLHRKWSKNYYEKPCEDVLNLMPDDAKNILSIGCGWGATEYTLKQRGANVTALPLDSVIGATAARLGIEVVYGTLAEGLTSLDDRRFDSVLISNLLHLQPDPGSVLEQCIQFAAPGGTLIIVGPNFKRLPILIKRALGHGDYRKLGSFEQSGIIACGPRSIAKIFCRAGFRLDVVKWWNEPDWQKGCWIKYKKHLGWLTGENWIIRAHRLS